MAINRVQSQIVDFDLILLWAIIGEALKGLYVQIRWRECLNFNQREHSGFESSYF